MTTIAPGPDDSQAAVGATAGARDSLEQYLGEIGRYPLLTAADETRLAKRVERGDSHAREQLINSNLRLVVSIAKHYRAGGVPLVDLIQDGSLGLMKAVDRFDWRRGFRFSTYATWWIRQAVQRGLQTTAETIRIPVHVAEQSRNVRTVETELTGRLARQPTEWEIAAEAGLSVEQLRVLVSRPRVAQTLDQPAADSDSVALVVSDTMLTEVEVERRAAASAIRRELGRLPRDQREVVALRFGFGRHRPMTVAEVGSHLGLANEIARRLEKSALRRLASSNVLAGVRD